MDLPGSPYLYALATVSITFVGFSALIMVFRQTIGGGMTRYDSYFTLSFIQVGFMVTAGSLLPALLGSCGLAHETVWRASSAIAAVPVLAFVARVPARRRAATGGLIPAFVWVFLSLQLAAGVALALNAIGTPVKPGFTLYASAMTVIQFTTGLAFLLALSASLHQHLDAGQAPPGSN